MHNGYPSPFEKKISESHLDSLFRNASYQSNADIEYVHFMALSCNDIQPNFNKKTLKHNWSLLMTWIWFLCLIAYKLTERMPNIAMIYFSLVFNKH